MEGEDGGGDESLGVLVGLVVGVAGQEAEAGALVVVEGVAVERQFPSGRAREKKPEA